jgi:probable O-glycosylation ligase (exosortase A-associated)
MLRTIFVFIIIAVGVFYAAQGPFYALLFYLWNAYFRPEDWVWNGAETVGILKLSYWIGLYLVVTAGLSARVFRLNSRTVLLLLFLAQCLIGTMTSEHPDTSWAFLREFVKVLLVSYLIVVLVTDRRRFRIILLVIAFSMGFETAKQGWAGLVLHPGGKNDNPIAFLGDNNDVAVGTLMLVPVFVALAQSAARPVEMAIHRFFAFGVLMRGIVTYSRGGFLAAGALGLVTFVRSPRKIRAFVGVVIVSVFVWTFMPPEFWKRMNTITVDDQNRDESAAGRIHFWGVAVEMAQAKPLTGVGLNCFEASYAKYDPRSAFGGGRSAHSTWFGVLGELGYPGIILFVAILVAAARSCLRVSALVKNDPSKRELRMYANGLLTSLIVFSVAGTFLSEQYVEMLWHFVGLCTALHQVALSEVPAVETVTPEPAPMYPALARS